MKVGEVRTVGSPKGRSNGQDQTWDGGPRREQRAEEVWTDGSMMRGGLDRQIQTKEGLGTKGVSEEGGNRR